MNNTYVVCTKDTITNGVGAICFHVRNVIGVGVGDSRGNSWSKGVGDSNGCGLGGSKGKGGGVSNSFGNGCGNGCGKGGRHGRG